MIEAPAVGNDVAMNYLHVHGKLAGITPDPAGGGAAIVQVEVDSFQDRNGQTNNVGGKLSIVFFCPSYRPAQTARGEPAYVHLWLLAGSSDVSISARTERWIRLLGSNPEGYDYSAMGEIFRDPQTGYRYIDAGIPISLHLGGDKDLGKVKLFAQEGIFIRIERGSLFGDIESPDSSIRR